MNIIFILKKLRLYCFFDELWVKNLEVTVHVFHCSEKMCVNFTLYVHTREFPYMITLLEYYEIWHVYTLR